ncbi:MULTISPECIES: hypothetical protein [Devosia]|uniref:Uncharacterized protein n=1 Tax=Devosia equisanguinis TaxID=2490941 RepID=A0A447I874_9HYPH|nr:MULTISPECIES: hypothetical protein [Devosia]ODT48683.1 MAG: hypothetical protein ABS74_11070 [Pelagibacterium sp. SCN 63-126]ODU82539.1 MAG: hypothetical protein ABT14_16695 [Pelagibacterium sp. SCN 63-17]OJX41973.1 MAG: hypothetical protein BGO80_10480 [Devosia sp. 63-57]VDS03677.1 hypothetical protein DEVEQU_00805 [Devosia equisanguinis]
MRFTKTLALAAVIATGATAAYASPFDANVSFDALNNASSATVLKVNPTQAKSLAIDVDTASLQQLIKNNRYLQRNIEQQGYSIDQIIGIDGDLEGSNVTLYAL